MFADIKGDPEGLQDPELCKTCSLSCYDCTRQCCYGFLIILFAPFIAFVNGCYYATSAFNQVWCVGPCFRTWKNYFSTLSRSWKNGLIAVFAPFLELLRLCFLNIRFPNHNIDIKVQQYNNIPDEENQKILDEESQNITEEQNFVVEESQNINEEQIEDLTEILSVEI